MSKKRDRAQELIDEAKRVFKEKVQELGIDSDRVPQTHEERLLRDTFLFGRHYDRVDEDGVRTCIDRPQEIEVTSDVKIIQDVAFGGRIL